MEPVHRLRVTDQNSGDARVNGLEQGVFHKGIKERRAHPRLDIGEYLAPEFLIRWVDPIARLDLLPRVCRRGGYLSDFSGGFGDPLGSGLARAG